MGLLEELEENRKALAELEKGEEDGNIEETGSEENEGSDGEDDGGQEADNKEESDDSESEAEEEDGEAEGDGGSEEGDEEDTEEKGKKEELDAAGYARLRREKAAEVKRRRELEEELERLRNQGKPKQAEQKKEDPEPDINKDPIEWLKWDKRQRDEKFATIEAERAKEKEARESSEVYEKATQEFQAIERDFARRVSDYEEVSGFVARKVAESIRVLNPSITQAELQAQTQERILLMAASYHNQGLNPVEELYHTARDVYGYTEPDGEEEETPRKKSNLKTLAKNKKRSAGMAGSKGRSGTADVTLEVAADMSAAEFAKLPAETKRRLLGEEL